MKAISLWQPWASLIACGDKPFETRHWAPPRQLIGQRIAIHAAKKVDREAIDLMGIFGHAAMPAGCVVCTALLIGAYQCGEEIKEGLVKIVRRIEMPEHAHIDPGGIPTDDFGDYSPGRWAWRLADVQVINPPTPVVGHQGFFDLPQVGWSRP